MTAILPQTTRSQIGMAGRSEVGGAGFQGHRTLYLLHGMSDDDTIWQRRTSIERYVAPLGLAVVMPAANRSYYTDMASGPRYWTFISEELPALARSFFRLSERREDNFVAGLSMGGYGAFKLALRCPDRFAAAASLSGALDMNTGVRETEPDRRAEMQAVFGRSDGVREVDDLLKQAEALVKSGTTRPRLYQRCGTDDFLIQRNRTFHEHAKRIGLDVEYREDPGFAHTWDYWDMTIQDVLRWLLSGNK